MARVTPADLNSMAELAAAMMTPEQMEEFAQVAAAMGDTRTLRNRFLIYIQRKNVSNVAGYNAWIKAGRQVRKGETGLAILAGLSVPSKKTEGGEAAPAEGEKSKGEKTRIRGVKVVYVFDISQTEPIEGEETQGLPAPAGEKPTTEEITEVLKSFTKDDDGEGEAAAA